MSWCVHLGTIHQIVRISSPTRPATVHDHVGIDNVAASIRSLANVTVKDSETSSEIIKRVAVFLNPSRSRNGRCSRWCAAGAVNITGLTSEQILRTVSGASMAAVCPISPRSTHRTSTFRCRYVALRTTQISSHGQLRAHSSDICGCRLGVSSGGRTSIRFSMSNPFARSRRIQSPCPR